MNYLEGDEAVKRMIGKAHRVKEPYFVILTSPSGGVMPLMGNEYELAMFETELLAKDAVLDNGLDDSFGFEIFKLDKDEKKQPRKRDEGDYIAAARKETFEKLEPLRKVLFNIARDSEVNCNTKNCMLYSSKAEQNCNGINSGVSPSINDCPKYTPKDAPEYVRMKHNITDIQEEFCANPCCPNHSIPMGRENHYHKCERDDLSSTDDIIYTHPIRKGIWLCENCISAIDFFINLK